MTFTWYSQLPCLTLSIKRDSVESKPASFVVPLVKTLSGIRDGSRVGFRSGRVRAGFGPNFHKRNQVQLRAH